MPLLPGEKKEIEELLPSTTSEEDKNTIFSILGQAMCRPTGIQVVADMFSFQTLCFCFCFIFMRQTHTEYNSENAFVGKIN